VDSNLQDIVRTPGLGDFESNSKFSMSCLSCSKCLIGSFTLFYKFHRIELRRKGTWAIILLDLLTLLKTLILRDSSKLVTLLKSKQSSIMMNKEFKQ
jgi:hypothetical protein